MRTFPKESQTKDPPQKRILSSVPARLTAATTREFAMACPRITFTSLGPHALRGKAQPVEVFEVAP